MIKITVPATSANLGAGFDCMGLGVDIYNEVTVEPHEGGPVIETDPDLPSDKSNLIYRALRLSMRYIKKKNGDNVKTEYYQNYLASPTSGGNLLIKTTNNIPKASGLGSSAACIVAGVLAADALCGNVLTHGERIDLANYLDGHPDNVAPALLGGITAAFYDGNTVRYMTLPPPQNISVVFFTPDFPLPTRSARAVLPNVYSRADAVSNIAHAVLTFAALQKGDMQLLRQVVGDKIHEPYRQALVPNLLEIKAYAAKLGGAAYLSGAGPTVAAFCDKDFDGEKMLRFLTALPNNWRMRRAKILTSGAKVSIGNKENL